MEVSEGGDVDPGIALCPQDTPKFYNCQLTDSTMESEIDRDSKLSRFEQATKRPSSVSSIHLPVLRSDANTYDALFCDVDRTLDRKHYALAYLTLHGCSTHWREPSL